MTAAASRVEADELTAVPDPVPGGWSWSVWRGEVLVGVLEEHRAGGAVWLAGRIDEDLVAEGPTALCVLRRLACRAHARCTPSSSPSPVGT